MATYEATGDEQGNHFVSRDGKDVVRLPIVSATSAVTVCEFERLDPTLAWQDVVALIRRELLFTFIGGAYDRAELELVDLDERRWARVPFGADVNEADWVRTDSAWPPGIVERRTALRGAPRPEALPLQRSVDGFRTGWSALATLGGATNVIVSAHGKRGVLWVTDLERGQVDKKLPEAGAALMQLVCGADGTTLGVENQVDHVHVLRDGAWSRVTLGTGHLSAVALSPDGTELAAAARGGALSVFAWPSLTFLRTWTPRHRAEPKPKWTRDSGALWNVAWSSDGRHLVVGHSWPVIAVYSAADGSYVRHFEGTQHFQRHYVLARAGDRDRLLASLRMNTIDVLDANGERRIDLPNTSNYGLSSGGFTRDGRVVVTECNEGVARVWSAETGERIGEYPCAKGEPILVVDDVLVVRNASTKRLEVCDLRNVA